MGRFQKGQSGNPGGRKKLDKTITELARAHTEAAMKALIEVMNDKDSPPSARVAAAQAILDRGYGKAPQTIDATVSDLSTMSIEERRARLAFLLTRIDEPDEADDTRH